jgi:methyltransferase-like protein
MPPKIRPDVTIQHVGDESLVLDLKTGQIHQLNPTAAWILAQCNGEHSIESISKELAEHFSLDPDAAETDVTNTIEQLADVKVIDIE